MATYAALAELIARYARWFVLTGAGCSTESGIPDYRDADGEWRRGRPVCYHDFVASQHTRQRYWARNLAGWARLGRALPNEAHHGLAELERRGRIERLVTQNVDGLHSAAGSRAVLDLHGRVDRVRCISCGHRFPRRVLQDELIRRNPEFASVAAGAAPDGDAELAGVDVSTFDVPGCARCGGTLKSDVVFFGENVPHERVESAMTSLRQADALLVIGSSLMVYSGYRFARAAALAAMPIAVVNIGRTRADSMLTLKVEAQCADVLAYLCATPRLAAARPRALRAL